MTSAKRFSRGATTGDVLILLGALSVAAALLYPAWSARGFRARVDRAIADVDAVASAARVFRGDEDRWPAPAAPGQVPEELPVLALTGGAFDRVEYTLGWSTWEVVDSIEAPPVVELAAEDAPPDSVGPRLVPVVGSVGAVTVYSREVALLAELLEHYEDQTSFVLDTMWLLLLPERAEP